MSVVKSKPSLLKLRRGKRAGDTEVQVVEVKMEDGDLTVMAEPKSGSKASKCAKSLSNAAKLPQLHRQKPHPSPPGPVRSTQSPPSPTTQTTPPLTCNTNYFPTKRSPLSNSSSPTSPSHAASRPPLKPRSTSDSRRLSNALRDDSSQTALSSHTAASSTLSRSQPINSNYANNGGHIHQSNSPTKTHNNQHPQPLHLPPTPPLAHSDTKAAASMGKLKLTSSAGFFLPEPKPFENDHDGYHSHDDNNDHDHVLTPVTSQDQDPDLSLETALTPDTPSSSPDEPGKREISRLASMVYHIKSLRNQQLYGSAEAAAQRNHEARHFSYDYDPEGSSKERYQQRKHIPPSVWAAATRVKATLEVYHHAVSVAQKHVDREFPEVHLGYNPLQVRRNRKLRKGSHHKPSLNINCDTVPLASSVFSKHARDSKDYKYPWEVDVPELLSDIGWRAQNKRHMVDGQGNYVYPMAQHRQHDRRKSWVRIATPLGRSQECVDTFSSEEELRRDQSDGSNKLPSLAKLSDNEKEKEKSHRNLGLGAGISAGPFSFSAGVGSMGMASHPKLESPSKSLVSVNRVNSSSPEIQVTLATPTPPSVHLESSENDSPHDHESSESSVEGGPELSKLLSISRPASKVPSSASLRAPALSIVTHNPEVSKTSLVTADQGSQLSLHSAHYDDGFNEHLTELQYLETCFMLGHLHMASSAYGTKPPPSNAEFVREVTDIMEEGFFQLTNIYLPKVGEQYDAVGSEVDALKLELSDKKDPLLDYLLYEAEHLVTEVSTTLNLETRKTSERLKQIECCGAARDQVWCVCYFLLEWFVVLVMWFIWGIVTAARSVKNTFVMFYITIKWLLWM
ncbi:hypothetical protein B0I72DRAFT_134234 [Yarrowia lipolytica]|uniref:YALI0E03564p n=2 Tax=Yarrowia lipolytica TaxID=4952 RepID=Q6C758_YARLI|nr:YALI0E03564p [Yarrowia lipolytica CLIB122]AOW04902.1 hypothetical protein YALI1_E04278g [Yarrowia lipolytica]KAB8286269.1 hypothetical protein BKA91DRAFT_132196 [Yarrowia lipolytica]KAE8174677.1 hypothetical protein BKA90DRAFT_133802 [Yarrowia lipolytica]KAJ8056481.1 hypothetical protein LXG23DRAFT_14404 [Yarrowia lipolytica]QNP98765.1 Maintenance of telomere capping protein 4 [Yarrowia lipolytica]|eukprot:XP_503504.1 YALI0E03564p [Yarrowia lipolytica CLIB122]